MSARNRRAKPEEVSEDTLKAVAAIIGNSAAQRALDDLARRRAAGEDAACYRIPKYAVRRPTHYPNPNSFSPRPYLARRRCRGGRYRALRQLL